MKDPRAPISSDAPRARGFRRAARLVEARVRAAGEARGFAVSRLLTHWAEIVGPDLARIARPARIQYGRGGRGATLVLYASGAAAPLVQMRLPQITQRVNACYGYAAIERIRITQVAPEGGPARRPAYAPPPETAPPPAAAAEAAAAEIADPALRAALAALGSRILNRP